MHKFRGSITRPVRSLSTLRSFPSRLPSRTATQDSLTAGGQPSPTGSSPVWVPNEVSVFVYITSSSTKLCLAHCVSFPQRLARQSISYARSFVCRCPPRNRIRALALSKRFRTSYGTFIPNIGKQLWTAGVERWKSDGQGKVERS